MDQLLNPNACGIDISAKEHVADSGPKSKNQPKFNVKNHLFQVFGVDVTEIDGFKGTTALTVFSETGPVPEKKSAPPSGS